MMQALITNKNNPKVITVAGMVKNIRIGLTTVFNTESNKATKSAHLKSRTSTPGKISAATNTDKATVKILIM